MGKERKRALPFLAVIVIVAGCSNPAVTAIDSLAGVVGHLSCDGTGITVPGLDAEQVGNAAIITQVGLGLGAGVEGAQVGVAAAMTESSLRNVNHGDLLGPDSIGLFQQRDGWGPIEERTDPAKSANLFYTADKGPGVTGLLHIDGWQNMPIPQAAQAVEGSEFADGSNYVDSVPVAVAAVAAIQPACTAVTGGGGGQVGPPPAGLAMNSSQDPTTFGWTHPPSGTEPYSFGGHSFGEVAAGTRVLWDGLFTDLVPLIPGGLNADLGCYEDRNNVNNPSVLSFHAFGLACDVNSGANPNGSSPASLSGEFVIPMEASAVAHKWGMEWGGDWTGTPDPMHFEIHVTPQQIAAITSPQPS